MRPEQAIRTSADPPVLLLPRMLSHLTACIPTSFMPCLCLGALQIFDLCGARSPERRERWLVALRSGVHLREVAKQRADIAFRRKRDRSDRSWKRHAKAQQEARSMSVTDPMQTDCLRVYSAVDIFDLLPAIRPRSQESLWCGDAGQQEGRSSLT